MVAKIQYEQKIMEKESERKIADIEGNSRKFSCHYIFHKYLNFFSICKVTMHVNKEKSLADAAFYKAQKETESNMVYVFFNL